MKKTYVLKFRFRSFFCKPCDLHIQFSGNDPVVGECPCCKTPLTNLPMESDAVIDNKKTVSIMKDDKELHD